MYLRWTGLVIDEQQQPGWHMITRLDSTLLFTIIYLCMGLVSDFIFVTVYLYLVLVGLACGIHITSLRCLVTSVMSVCIVACGMYSDRGPRV